MARNEYIPFLSEIKEVRQQTNIESTFRMAFKGAVKPGQFFEVSIPKYGEAPISVSGIGPDYVDLTIRSVGRVTNEIFNRHQGDPLFLRGPYGNGFDVEKYLGKELIIVAGGTGMAPVKGVVDYFMAHLEKLKGFTLIAGFKSPANMLFKKELKNWQTKGNVLLTVDQADETYEGHLGLVTDFIPKLAIQAVTDVQVIVVGPPMMMHFTVQEFLKRQVREDHIWISQERKMCCGIGKCGHCKIDNVYICLEGPVFNYQKGKHLID